MAPINLTPEVQWSVTWELKTRSVSTKFGKSFIPLIQVTLRPSRPFWNITKTSLWRNKTFNFLSLLTTSCNWNCPFSQSSALLLDYPLPLYGTLSSCKRQDNSTGFVLYPLFLVSGRIPSSISYWHRICQRVLFFGSLSLMWKMGLLFIMPAHLKRFVTKVAALFGTVDIYSLSPSIALDKSCAKRASLVTKHKCRGHLQNYAHKELKRKHVAFWLLPSNKIATIHYFAMAHILGLQVCFPYRWCNLQALPRPPLRPTLWDQDDSHTPAQKSSKVGFNCVQVSAVL